MNNTSDKFNVLPGEEDLEQVEKAIAVEKLQRIRTESYIAEKELLRAFKHFVWRSNRLKKSLVPNYTPPETITKAA